MAIWVIVIIGRIKSAVSKVAAATAVVIQTTGATILSQKRFRK